jgi:sugar phosphate isomerase/epimerase
MAPRLAAQLFSLKALLRDRAGLRSALRRLKAGGYEAVEAVPLDFLPAAELAAEIRDAGLDCCAFHQGAADLRAEPGRCAEAVKAFRCQYCVTALPTDQPLAGDGDAQRWGDALGKMASALAKEGLSLAYHPHHVEHQRFGGRLALDLIAEAAGPGLKFELDTFWTQRCGLDPAKESLRLGAQAPLLHLKDVKIIPSGEAITAAVGDGNLDWPSILLESGSSGCAWWVAEQSHFSGDPVEA